MSVRTGPSSHEWARQVDELRISRAEEQTAHDSEEGRVLRKLRRQIQKDALEHLDESFLLYGPDIDDKRIIGFYFEFFSVQNFKAFF